MATYVRIRYFTPTKMIENQIFELKEEHIIFLDNHLLVVNKPAGLLVQPDKEGSPNLEDAARTWLKLKFNKPGNVFATACHRLDRPVSGLIILARTSKALTRMNALFQQRLVKKIYLAVVEGRAEQEKNLRHWLKKNEAMNITRTYTYPRGDAKQADLTYHLWQEIQGRSLLLVRLFTGRHHQIRAQLSFSGLPILGDAKYGRRQENEAFICLNSLACEFLHPVSGEMLRLIGRFPDHGCWKNFSSPDARALESVFSLSPPM